MGRRKKSSATMKTRTQPTELVSKYEALALKEKEEAMTHKEKEEKEEEEEDDPLMSINWAEAPWPPVWKEQIEESPQYSWGMLHRFVERWPLEYEADEKPDSYFDVPPTPRHLLRRPPPVNIHRTIITFLQQLRKSRGYDVEVNAPWFVHSPFSVMTPFLEDPEYKAEFQEELSPMVNFALAQINTNAKPHGKCYELVKVVKYVDAMPHRTSLVTFTVKEIAPANNIVETVQAMVYTGAGRADQCRLVEWRFKPDDDE